MTFNTELILIRRCDVLFFQEKKADELNEDEEVPIRKDEEYSDTGLL